jgi:cytidine deaminase
MPAPSGRDRRWQRETACARPAAGRIRGRCRVSPRIWTQRWRRPAPPSPGRRCRLRDPTAHAELLAIRAACAELGSERLTGLDLYVTLEPCAMCAAAVSVARIARLYYGAPDPKSGGVEHGARVFVHRQAHHKPEVYGGIAEREAAALLRAFFSERR